MIRRFNGHKIVARPRGTQDSRHGWTRLDKNERITPFPREFLNGVLSKIDASYITLYPEVEELYSDIAKAQQLDVEQLVVTAGSDAAIRQCFDLCTRDGGEVVTLSPTFAMVDVYCELFKVTQHKIYYDRDLALNTDELVSKIGKSTRLVVIANPNSPTGTVLHDVQIVKILKRALLFGTIVLIDEAYYGFSTITMLGLVDKFSNLVVSRTFSKSDGLAGCRIGYLVAQQELAQQLYQFRPMYEVNSFGVLMARAILANPDVVKDYIEETEKGRSFLLQSFEHLGLPYLDTSTNFVHVDFGRQKNAIKRSLYDSRILIGSGLEIAGFEEFVRISIGPKESLLKLVEILTDVVRDT